MGTSEDEGILRSTVKSKRLISVGYKMSADCEMGMDDTIYVSLHKRAFGVGSKIVAEAKSAAEFYHRNEEEEILRGKTASNLSYTKPLSPYVSLNYEKFIDMLTRENNANVKNRCFNEGLDAFLQLREIHDCSGSLVNRL